MTTNNPTNNGSLPLAGLAQDGWSNEKEATATCFCGSVQMVFVSERWKLLLSVKILIFLPFV